MKLLPKPNVTSAVRVLEKALLKLDEALEHHRAEAERHLEAAAQATSQANAEALNAARAERVRTKVAELLA